MSARRGGTWFQRWRVPLGFLMRRRFLFCWPEPRPWTLAIGGARGFARAWACARGRQVTCGKMTRWRSTGPYAYTRNPLYLGSFVIGLGFTIAAGRWELALSFCRAVPGHLCPRDARRIRDAGRAVW